MARIIGIDYGIKKCGVSATDSMQIIVSAIDTFPTTELFQYLKKYISQEDVEKIVFGKPVHKDGTSTYLQEHIDIFVNKLLNKGRLRYINSMHIFWFSETKKGKKK